MINVFLIALIGLGSVLVYEMFSATESTESFTITSILMSFAKYGLIIWILYFLLAICLGPAMKFIARSFFWPILQIYHVICLSFRLASFLWQSASRILKDYPSLASHDPQEVDKSEPKIVPLPVQPVPPAAPSDSDRAERIGESLSLIPLTGITYTTCPNGHELSTGQDEYDKVCNFCGERIDPKAGLWLCSACDFCVCSLCRVPTPLMNIQYPACKLGHPLVLSRFENLIGKYRNNKYQCVICLNSDNPCSEGRYFCGYCLVDVCYHCQTVIKP